MRYLPEHGAHYIEQLNDRGRLYVSANDLGVSLWLKDYGRTRNDYIRFGIAPEEAKELGNIADELASHVPELADVRLQHDEKQKQREAEFGWPPRPLQAKAPVVHSLRQEDEFEHSFWGGTFTDLEIPAAPIVLGGMRWTRDQLIFQINNVDALLFRPDAFRELGQVALAQPEFPMVRSVWDNVK